MARNNKITKLIAGRRALIEEKLPNNWETLDVNNIELPQDTTLCIFCGNAAIRPEQVNGNSKIVESHIPSNIRNRINVYSFGYTSEPIKSDGYILSKEYEEEAYNLYKKTFEPLLFDKKGNMKSMQGIEASFSKLIFAAHCGGCNFSNVIIDNLYKTLLTKYKEPTTDMLINKIQYFAYAPNEMPIHNVNAFIIAPYIDPGFSWAKSLAFAEAGKVDVDYPRGILKKLFKAKTGGDVQSVFDSAFAESRAIMFKMGHTVCMIPSQMNKNQRIGDHSIALVAKYPGDEPVDDFDETKKIARGATSLFIKGFASHKPVDSKSMFSLISGELANNPPNSQLQPE